MPSHRRLIKFWNKIIKTEKCWFYKGSLSKDGYAHITIEGKKVYGHRLTYELLREPIPEGKILHHVVCENRACINPFHVEPVTRSTHPGIGAPVGNNNRCKNRVYINKS